MEIRRLDCAEEDKVRELFYETIHTVNRPDYSPLQLEAWASFYWERARWQRKIKEDFFIGVFAQEVLCGFASLTSEGVVDLFFVHKNYQRAGVGSLLLNALETQARSGYKISVLWADVSITARPFFERKGFEKEKIYTKEVKGVLFENTLMYKRTEVFPLLANNE
jgi:putative acetyltransferase